MIMNKQYYTDYGLIRTNRSYKTILCIVSLFFLFFPTGLFLFFPSLSNYYRAVQFLGLFFVLLYILVSVKEISINKGIVLSILILLVELLSTTISGGSIFKALYEGIRLVGVLWIVSNEIKRNAFGFYDRLKMCLYIIGIANVLFSFYWYENNTSLFGLNGEFPNYAIPVIAIVALDYNKKGTIEKFVFSLFVIVNAYCMLFLIDSSTAKVGVVVLSMLFIFDRFTNKVSPTILLYVYLGLVLAIVVFRITNSFGFVIEDVLGESITLHKRTIAWDYAFELIGAAPILGYGFLGSEYQYSIVYKYTNGWFAHPHDEILRIFLIGGIISVILVVCMMFYIVGRLRTCYSYKSIRIITYALFTMLIMSIVETCFNSFFYILIAFGLNSDLVIGIKDDNKLITN